MKKLRVLLSVLLVICMVVGFAPMHGTASAAKEDWEWYWSEEYRNKGCWNGWSYTDGWYELSDKWYQVDFNTVKVPVEVNAAGTVSNGAATAAGSTVQMVGTNFSYFYNEWAGTLIIRGTGEMPSFSEEYPAPWARLKDKVARVIFERNITKISSNAFVDFSRLRSVVLPATLKAIDPDAFVWSDETRELKTFRKLERIESSGDLEVLDEILKTANIPDLLDARVVQVTEQAIQTEIWQLTWYRIRRPVRFKYDSAGRPILIERIDKDGNYFRTAITWDDTLADGNVRSSSQPTSADTEAAGKDFSRDVIEKRETLSVTPEGVEHLYETEKNDLGQTTYSAAFHLDNGVITGGTQTFSDENGVTKTGTLKSITKVGEDTYRLWENILANGGGIEQMLEILDKFGRLSEIQVNDKTVLQNTYKSNGLLESRTVVDSDSGSSTTYTYNYKGNELQSVDANTDGNVTNAITYTYNDNGSMATKVQKQGTSTVTTSYNLYNRATKEVITENGTVKYVYEYSYDGNGVVSKRYVKNTDGKVIRVDTYKDGYVVRSVQQDPSASTTYTISTFTYKGHNLTSEDTTTLIVAPKLLSTLEADSTDAVDASKIDNAIADLSLDGETTKAADNAAKTADKTTKTDADADATKMDADATKTDADASKTADETTKSAAEVADTSAKSADTSSTDDILTTSLLTDSLYTSLAQDGLKIVSATSLLKSIDPFTQNLTELEETTVDATDNGMVIGKRNLRLNRAGNLLSVSTGIEVNTDTGSETDTYDSEYSYGIDGILSKVNEDSKDFGDTTISAENVMSPMGMISRDALITTAAGVQERATSTISNHRDRSTVELKTKSDPLTNEVLGTDVIVLDALVQDADVVELEDEAEEPEETVLNAEDEDKATVEDEGDDEADEKKPDVIVEGKKEEADKTEPEDDTTVEGEGDEEADENKAEIIIEDKKEDTVPEADPKEEGSVEGDEENKPEEMKAEIIVEEKKEETVVEDKKEETAPEDKKEETIPEDKKEETVVEDKKEETVVEDKKEETVVEDKKEETVPEDKKEETVVEDKKEETVIEDKKEEIVPEDKKEEVVPEEEKKEETVPEVIQEEATPKAEPVVDNSAVEEPQPAPAAEPQPAPAPASDPAPAPAPAPDPAPAPAPAPDPAPAPAPAPDPAPAPAPAPDPAPAPAPAPDPAPAPAPAPDPAPAPAPAPDPAPAPAPAPDPAPAPAPAPDPAPAPAPAPDPAPAAEPDPVEQDEHKIICPNCGTHFSDIKCPNCGWELES